MYMISLSSSAVECCGFEETLRASQLAVVGVDKCIFPGGSKTTLRCYRLFSSLRTGYALI